MRVQKYRHHFGSALLEHWQVAHHHYAVTDALLGPYKDALSGKRLTLPGRVILETIMNCGRGRKRSEPTLIELKALFETVTQEQERRKIEPGSSAIRIQRECASIRALSLGPLAAFILNKPEVDVCAYVSRIQRQRPPAIVFGSVQVPARPENCPKAAQRFRIVWPKREGAAAIRFRLIKPTKLLEDIA